MKLIKVIALIILGSLLIGSCKEEPKTEPIKGLDTLTRYNLEIPVGFPDMFIKPNNPLTLEGVALGRMLYYDPILDGISTRKCASCHDQKIGFTTFESNSLAHINLGWNKSFLWNGAVEGTLEDIMYFEVEEFFKTDLERVNASTKYRDLFKKVFDVDKITYRELAFALAQFERTKISANSKYDKYLAGSVILSAEELNGLNIYFSEKGDCFHCHGTKLLTDGEFHNNGLDRSPKEGRMKVTRHIFDEGAFKTPTLRNIALTAPYMHDGRFKTLEEVIDFYSEGLQYSMTIDPLMKGVLRGGVQLNAKEKSDLLAFLHCFTDPTFLNDPALSEP